MRAMFLSLAGLLAAAAAAEPAPRVPAVKVAPNVDGDLSEAAWEKAAVFKLDGYCDAERRAKGQKPRDATEARLVTDAAHLYVAFRCAESHPDGPWVFENARHKRRRNSHVMGGDYVVAALDLGRWGFYNYYMFFINAKGEVYTCFTWPHRYDLVLTGAGMPEVKGAAKVDKAGKRWTAEMKVPLKDLLRHPADGFPKLVGLDLRRLQWGDERGKHKFSVYWTGMANVVGNRIKPQYERMATWKPLFKKFPNYSTSYSCGRGWVQLIFPESFAPVAFDAGTIDNKFVSGAGARIIGHVNARMGWDTSRRKRITRELDGPRMEYWDDLRPEHPAGEPEVIMTGAPASAAKPRFAARPTATAAGKTTRIAFTAAAATDVAVAILDAEGKVARHLAAGVLGKNPPAPFKAGSLAQELVWDHRDDAGKPVKAGAYRVRVSLGLGVKFHRAIELKKAWVSKDKWPGGLDVEHMPEPKHAWPLGHHSGGAVNYLSLDRARDELYVQQRYVFQGESGKLLRELKLSPPPGSPFRNRGFGNGEIAFGPDGLLYVSGSNELWRFDRAGKPVDFKAVGRPFIPELWGAHSNPHRGVCVSSVTGDVYRAHHYQAHNSNRLQITRLSPDGRISKYGFIELRAPGAGVKVDRAGNVYVGSTVQPPEALPPKDLKVPEKIRKPFKRLYGSIVKFGPEGGIIRPDPAGKLGCPYRKGLLPYAAQGAVWVHPGYSPMLSRIMDRSGGPGCSCRNARFDLDEFGRLFVPDAIAGRVEVIDSNANTILFFGRRGTPGADGVELGWGSQVAAGEAACYVADYQRYRVSRMKLQYAAEEEVAVTVR